MANLHNTAPPVEPHQSTSTPVQEPATSSVQVSADQGSESSSSLVHKLIGTTELCEQILGYLSRTELCRAKRVCKRFQNIIDISLLLQKHLFLKPCSGPLLEGYIKTNDPFHSLYDFHPLITADIAQSPESDFQVAIWPMQDHDPSDNRFYSNGPVPSMNKLVQTFENVNGLSDWPKGSERRPWNARSGLSYAGHDDNMDWRVLIT